MTHWNRLRELREGDGVKEVHILLLLIKYIRYLNDIFKLPDCLAYESYHESYDYSGIFTRVLILDDLTQRTSIWRFGSLDTGTEDGGRQDLLITSLRIRFE